MSDEGDPTFGQARPADQEYGPTVIKDLAEVQHAFEVYTWAHKQIVGLKEQQDQARSVIEAYLGDAEVGTLNGKKAVTWHYRKERRFDLKKARELHPEMVEECTETRRHRYFVPVSDES